MVAAVRGACQRVFHCSPIVRGMPLSTQLQLMRGHVLSGATYLMSTTALSTAQWDHMEVPVRERRGMGVGAGGVCSLEGFAAGMEAASIPDPQHPTCTACPRR